jgi:hypothetical protein
MSNGADPPPTGAAAARRHQSQPNRATTQFVPKIPGIETLGTSTEQRGHDFAKFLKSIHHHALTTFRNSKDISKAIVEFTDPLAALKLATLSLSEIRRENGLDPTPPAADETETAKFLREADNADRRDEVKLLYGIQLKLLAERETDLTQNLTILWATIMGQCTPALQEEVHGDPDYSSKSSSFDSVWLLQSLQKITAGVNKTTNKYHSAFKATKKFYSTQQHNTESIDEFYNRFENAKDLVGLFNADIVDLASLLTAERVQNPNATKETAMQKYLAVALIMNANKVKYEALWNKLENDLLVGQDSYPKTIGDATHLLTNWKASTALVAPNSRPPAPNHPDRRPSAPAVTFVSTEWATLVPLPANNDFSALAGFDSTRPTLAPSRKPPHNISAEIECVKCKKKGHYATACPFIAPAGAQFFQFVRPSVQLNQTQAQSILIPGSIIVDSGSTFNCFRERNLISNIHSCDPFSTLSNGGGMTYTKKGTVTVFQELDCYYNPECLVNIISLDCLQTKYHTTFDSEKKNAFTVEVSDVLTITFEGFGSGLYFVNLNNPVNAYPLSLLNTVTENKQFFSRREIEGAEASRAQQGQIGWPSDQEYYEIIRDNLLTNSKATLDDLRRAEHIFGGTAVDLLKGKTVYKPINTNASIERIPLPPIILKTHPSDDLDVDFLYIQGAPYLLMKSTKIKFHATQAFNRISKRKKKTIRTTYKRGPQDIINGIEKVLTVFRNRGFQVNLINADNEFKKLEHKVSTHVEICAAGQHIPHIERGIRFLKDRTRCFWVSLPFKKVPKIMIDECLTMVTTCLNDFPSKNGISTTMSPASIVLGRGKIDGNNLKATFGRYYEVYCGTDNTNKERRTSAICLRPSNSQGGYYFMNIQTAKKIHGYRFTELSMPQHIIDKVHDLADAENAPDLDEDGCPLFEWELGAPVNAEAEAFPHVPPMHAAPDDESEGGDSTDDDGDVEVEDDDDNTDDESIGSKNDHHEASDDDESISDDATPDPQLNARSDDGSVESVNNDEDEDDEDHELDELRSEVDPENIVESKRNRTATTQPNISSFGGKYHVNMLNIGQDAFSKFERVKTQLHSTAVGVCFNQMTASKGIKLYGAKAVAAMFKEYKQLDDLEVLGRLNPDSLTHDHKHNALRAVNLIKIKRDGKVKGRACADGSKQRNYVPRDEASSPTLSLEALMAILLINAYEERDTAIFDVPGAYLHAKIPDDKFAILKIEGEFVDIMCEVNPEYKADIRFENGKKVLYVQILAALYGMIESALLWYTLYTEVLHKEGFKINPYDRCVANKVINGEQCTIGWYVDDNILSHVETSVVDSVINKIEGYFPGLVVERGKDLNFLGMEIGFLEKGKLKLGLVQYISGMIEELEEALEPYGENLDRDYPHPAAKWLFTVKPDTEELNEAKADIFRKFVAKLIWVMKRGRPDVEPTVSFLSTRVKAPDKDDWHKFKRLMCWVKKTKADVRIIGADDLLNMIVMIDSAHAVHDDMRGHTGGVTSFGTGVVDQKSSKQKMNTRSSTETEHVGTSEYLPKPVFFELFMGAQGYKPHTILAKDNESEIRMLINGKASCTSNSKHVAIKYFWCTDRIKKGNVSVRHCPTEKMVADYMSKALQGKLFVRFRNVIMGWQHISTLFDIFSSTEKRVESNGCLAVKPKTTKLTYAEAVRLNDVVDAQDEVIANGGDPIADLVPLTATGLNPSIANGGDPITGLMKLDIKKK